MRARYPDTEGTVERNGATLHYEVYENEGPTIFLAPTWQIIHSRHWKMQIPYLSRHYRVVTCDPVGNGKSDRHPDPERFAIAEVVADSVAVLDATGTDTCVAVGLSYGGGLVTIVGALHPDRVDAIVAIAPSHPWGVPHPDRAKAFEKFDQPVADPEGWAKYNLHYWRENWQDFAEFFFSQSASDDHSTKLIDDTVGWALETTGEQIAIQSSATPPGNIEEIGDRVRSLEVPALIIQGTGDRLITLESSRALYDMLPNSELAVLEGAGHLPNARYPVKVNSLIRGFVDRVHQIPRPETRWHIGTSRPKRALYVSSPIGLGHARRDVAIAGELRDLEPDLAIDWLAQDPVTRVLETAQESIHPASTLLANESGHIEAESGEHDLHAFQAIRNMDEILNANFMVFDEVVADGGYDLVIADESWDLDYHLHENPEIKKAPMVWMTDFVGWVPMPSGGDREAYVAADYNAEMIEQVARYGRVRDKAIFVGAPDDIIDRSFGPGLPHIREWTEANFQFSGYVTGFDPTDLGPRDELRAELGYEPDERVCIVSVGGSGVGRSLLERISKSYSKMSTAIAELRMVVVTGPRIDPGSLPQIPGVEYRAYVDRLYRHLTACDLAIVQGGLTTTMELTSARVPFIYVPLWNHFEQNFHVRKRLERYRAGRHMDYDDIDPDSLADAAAETMSRPTGYLEVETDGAQQAAAMIAELI